MIPIKPIGAVATAMLLFLGAGIAAAQVGGSGGGSAGGGAGSGSGGAGGSLGGGSTAGGSIGGAGTATGASGGSPLVLPPGGGSTGAGGNTGINAAGSSETGTGVGANVGVNPPTGLDTTTGNDTTGVIVPPPLNGGLSSQPGASTDTSGTAQPESAAVSAARPGEIPATDPGTAGTNSGDTGANGLDAAGAGTAGGGGGADVGINLPTGLDTTTGRDSSGVVVPPALNSGVPSLANGIGTPGQGVGTGAQGGLGGANRAGGINQTRIGSGRSGAKGSRSTRGARGPLTGTGLSAKTDASLSALPGAGADTGGGTLTGTGISSSWSSTNLAGDRTPSKRDAKSSRAKSRSRVSHAKNSPPKPSRLARRELKKGLNVRLNTPRSVHRPNRGARLRVKR